MNIPERLDNAEKLVGNSSPTRLTEATNLLIGCVREMHDAAKLNQSNAEALRAVQLTEAELEKLRSMATPIDSWPADKVQVEQGGDEAEKWAACNLSVNGGCLNLEMLSVALKHLDADSRSVYEDTGRKALARLFRAFGAALQQENEELKEELESEQKLNQSFAEDWRNLGVKHGWPKHKTLLEFLDAELTELAALRTQAEKTQKIAEARKAERKAVIEEFLDTFAHWGVEFSESDKKRLLGTAKC